MSLERKKNWLEVVKEIPGVSPIVSFTGAVIHELEVHKFEDFLDSLRVKLDLEGDQLAEHIHRHRRKKWMAEGLSRGWKLIQETMDPLARRCAEAMVAEYMRDEKAPDRFHRQFANFFMESDSQTLAMTMYMAEALEEAGANWASLVHMKNNSGPSAPSAPSGFYMFFAVEMGTHSFIFEHDFFYEAWDVLLRNALVSPWSGGGFESAVLGAEIDGNVGMIDSRQVGRLKQLRRYLVPLKHEIITAGHLVAPGNLPSIG